MREKIQALRNNKVIRNPFSCCLILAFVYNLFIETLARHSMPGYGGLYYMVHNPLVFLINMLIIYATLIICALTRKRTFLLTFISVLWLAIGITNGIILSQRMTPFTMKDLSSLKDGLTIITNYFSAVQIALIIGVLLFWLWDSFFSLSKRKMLTNFLIKKILLLLR